MPGDLPSPHRTVGLLARSQPSTFHASLARLFPSYFRSFSLPFHWYISPHHVHISLIVSVIFWKHVHHRCPSDVLPDRIMDSKGLLRLNGLLTNNYLVF